MHGIFRVVSVFVLEFSAVNVFLSLLAKQSFHLVVGESEEWFHMTLRKEKCWLSGETIPGLGRKRARREQEMPGRWIALGGQSCPFNWRVQANVYVVWPVAAGFASSGENKMLLP